MHQIYIDICTYFFIPVSFQVAVGWVCKWEVFERHVCTENESGDENFVDVGGEKCN